MHDNPVKRNGGRESVTRQFAALQAVVSRNVRNFKTDDTEQVSATALPLFVFLSRQFERPLERHEGRISNLSVCSGKEIA